MNEFHKALDGLLERESTNTPNPKAIPRDTLLRKTIFEVRCFVVYLRETLFHLGEISYINIDTLEVERKKRYITSFL